MRQRSMRTWLALALVLASGCTSSHTPPPGVRPCPLLMVGEGETMVSYGALAGRSTTFVPGSCVEVYADDERIARTFVTDSSTFAVQFQVRGDARARRLELRLDDLAGSRDQTRYTLDLPERFAAEIAYAPGTTPLEVRESGLVEFTGWLAPRPGAAEISDVWMVNWSSGMVEPVAPTPRLDQMFMSSIRGQPGHCVSPLSTHGALDADFGGCWWPRGGGGCGSGCTEEQIAAGECYVGGGCTGGRGCTVLDVTERRSGAPPPELPHEIPTGRPDPGPPDAGPPDGGPRDGGPRDGGTMRDAELT